MAMAYMAQHKDAESASRSPAGRISNDDPWLNMMHPTPTNAMAEPISTGALRRWRNTAAARYVVYYGEMDASSDTLAVVVSVSA